MNQSVQEISFSHLSVPDRIALAQRIWDSVVEENPNIELSPGLRDELDKDYADYEANPDDVVGWEEVKQNLALQIETTRYES